MTYDFSQHDTTKITGIFGGSFDPVHIGHVALAAELLNKGAVEHIIFMPAARAPHKLSGNPVSAGDRIAMLRLATGDHDAISVSDFEVDRGGISYTVDTLTTFAEHFGDNLRMIIGMDSLLELHKWYQARELVEMCGFITYCRPGFPKPNTDTLTQQFGHEGAQQLLKGIVEADVFDVSSTEVRQQLKQQNFTEVLIPESVCCYIKENELYH